MKRVALTIFAITSALVVGMAGMTSAFPQTSPGFNNLAATIAKSAVNTATTVNTADQANAQWRGVTVIIDVSARTSGTYTPTIQGKDIASGQYYTVCAGGAISSVSTSTITVYPGQTVATGACSTTLPRIWRVQLVGTSTPSMTLTIGANLEQ